MAKTVRCCDCGLLAFTDFETKCAIEATPKARDVGRVWIKIPSGEMHDRQADPLCLAKRRSFKEVAGKPLVAELEHPFSCTKFVEYTPGIGPVETMRIVMDERVSDLQHQRTLLLSFIITLVGAIASAVATRFIIPPSPGAGTSVTYIQPSQK